MNQKTSKVEKEFYLRCSYLTLSVLFDKEPEFFADLTYAVFFFMSFTGSESSSVSFSPLIIFNNFFTATLDI